MFKLYYTDGTSGAANFIAACLAELDFESEQVDLATKKTASGADFYQVNPKGNVPTIVLPDGSYLNENVATLTFISEQNKSSNLIPKHSPAKFHFFNALGFINSEMHPAFGVLFYPFPDDAAKDKAKEKALSKVRLFVDYCLAGKKFILEGDELTTVDIYAYVVFSWADGLGVDLSGIEEVVDFNERVSKYPGVSDALEKIKAAKS